MKNSDRACRNIRAASTESQVIHAVSEYLDSLEPAGVVALLPAELMTIGLKQSEEVIHSSLQVAHDQIARLTGSDADTLSDIVLVLSTAARRLAILAKNTA